MKKTMKKKAIEKRISIKDELIKQNKECIKKIKDGEKYLFDKGNIWIKRF